MLRRPMTARVYPVAVKLATAILRDLIARKACLYSELYLAGHWFFGARQLASYLGDKAAADLLDSLDSNLREIAEHPGDGPAVLAKLGILAKQINSQRGQP